VATDIGRYEASMLVLRVCSASPTWSSYRQDMPRGRVENRLAVPHLLSGQMSIDDVLKDQYDLALQLPLRWAAFETTPPSRRRAGADWSPHATSRSV
jgi:hypothetical protein